MAVLPDRPLPDNAEVAVLCVRLPQTAGVGLELVVFRSRRMVHAYSIESYGRRFYRSLVYTSDARFCLRAMQPSSADRVTLWDAQTRHEAGKPSGASGDGSSVVITRDWTVEHNLSLGTVHSLRGPDRIVPRLYSTPAEPQPQPSRPGNLPAESPPLWSRARGPPRRPVVLAGRE